MKQYGLDYSQIQQIKLDCSPVTTNIMPYSEPETVSEAKFSLKYILGAATLDKKLTLSSFDENKIKSSKMQKAMSKVEVNTISDWPEDVPQFAGNITLVLHSGVNYSLRIDRSRGSREAPLTTDELLAKYRDCAKSILSPDETERTIELMLKLEKLNNVTELMGIITR
jgi:2-methylcitrate dehydratase PrpD